MKFFISTSLLLFTNTIFAAGPNKQSFLDKAPGLVAKEICAAGTPYKKCSQFTDEDCLSFATTQAVECTQSLTTAIPDSIPREQVQIWIQKLKACTTPIFVEKASKMTPSKFDHKCFINAAANHSK